VQRFVLAAARRPRKRTPRLAVKLKSLLLERRGQMNDYALAWAPAGKIAYQLPYYQQKFDNLGYQRPSDLPPTAEWSVDFILVYLKRFMPWGKTNLLI